MKRKKAMSYPDFLEKMGVNLDIIFEQKTITDDTAYGSMDKKRVLDVSDPLVKAWLWLQDKKLEDLPNFAGKYRGLGLERRKAKLDDSLCSELVDRISSNLGSTILQIRREAARYHMRPRGAESTEQPKLKRTTEFRLTESQRTGLNSKIKKDQDNACQPFDQLFDRRPVRYVLKDKVVRRDIGSSWVRNRNTLYTVQLTGETVPEIKSPLSKPKPLLEEVDRIQFLAETLLTTVYTNDEGNEVSVPLEYQSSAIQKMETEYARIEGLLPKVASLCKEVSDSRRLESFTEMLQGLKVFIDEKKSDFIAKVDAQVRSAVSPEVMEQSRSAMGCKGHRKKFRLAQELVVEYKQALAAANSLLKWVSGDRKDELLKTIERIKVTVTALHDNVMMKINYTQKGEKRTEPKHSNKYQKLLGSAMDLPQQLQSLVQEVSRLTDREEKHGFEVSGSQRDSSPSASSLHGGGESKSHRRFSSDSPPRSKEETGKKERRYSKKQIALGAAAVVLGAPVAIKVLGVMGGAALIKGIAAKKVATAAATVAAAGAAVAAQKDKEPSTAKLAASRGLFGHSDKEVKPSDEAQSKPSDEAQPKPKQ